MGIASDDARLAPEAEGMSMGIAAPNASPCLPARGLPALPVILIRAPVELETDIKRVCDKVTMACILDPRRPMPPSSREDDGIRAKIMDKI